MSKIKQLMEKHHIESELASFWYEIEKNLPNTIEMAQLGKMKVFQAFQVSYPIFRKYLYQELLKAIVEEIEDMRKDKKGNFPFPTLQDEVVDDIKSLLQLIIQTSCSEFPTY